MIHNNKILIFLFIVLISFSCSNTNMISDAEIENRAFKIVESYDSTNIDIFKTWSYTPRGQAGIWSKNSGDSNLYSCIYFDFEDSITLSVMRQKHFFEDFKINLPYDTAYWRISFTKTSDCIMDIIGVDNHGQDVLIKEQITIDSIFKSIDPFDTFQYLTDLRDSLNFFGVHYYERLGGFIQFNLSTYYILTYIPDFDSLNPKYKQIWIREFDKGKMIRKKWNLRKLENPIDTG